MIWLALGGCADIYGDGDVSLVAVDGEPITFTTASARIDALLLDDCEGGTVTVLVGDTVDLLASDPAPRTLPSGQFCGLAVEFASDPDAGALELDGMTAGGSVFAIAEDPGTVPIAAEWDTTASDWVLVLDGRIAVDAAAVDEVGGVSLTPSEAGEFEADLPAALWFGPVTEARDTIYIDLWPFPDVVFDDGNGGADAPRGCASEPPGIPDIDGDGIADADDPDRDGDGIDNSGDDDADGDGLLDGGDDPDGGGGGGGGSSGSSGGCDGGGSGSGCDGGSSSGSGCDGGGGGSDCGSGCDCGSGSACSTAGFAPAFTASLAVLFLRRRRRDT
jgi:hypothetical protein